MKRVLGILLVAAILFAAGCPKNPTPTKEIRFYCTGVDMMAQEVLFRQPDGITLGRDAILYVAMPNNIAGGAPIIEGALYIDGVPQPDPVILSKAFDGPGERDCFNADGADPERCMLVVATKQGRARIVGTCGEARGELPVQAYYSFGFAGQQGLVIGPDGFTPQMVADEASTVYYDWSILNIRLRLPAYKAGSWRFNYFISDFAAVKTVDLEQLAAGVPDIILCENTMGDSIYVCQLPSGEYMKIMYNQFGLFWEVQAEPAFM